MSLGPLMIDLAGPGLSAEEAELLRHPLCGGVILFSRNYESPEQLAVLCREIHALRRPRLLIAVDHEGGAVQRFREGFTELPPAAAYGRLYRRDRALALRTAREAGWLLAAELRAVGVDFSFAPVLDIGAGVSRVINDRAFHNRPEVIARLAAAFMHGMGEAGMAAVGKHFPGHGCVEADSHHEIPRDPRHLVDIRLRDLIPFERLIHAGLAAVMPAHVIYPAVDPLPAGFSRRWLEGVLRRELGFSGAVFSDDLSMAGAAVAGGYPERMRLALSAGCDMALICNAPPGAVPEVIDNYHAGPSPLAQARLMRMHGRHELDRQALQRMPRWQAARELVAALEPDPELGLGDDELL